MGDQREGAVVNFAAAEMTGSRRGARGVDLLRPAEPENDGGGGGSGGGIQQAATNVLEVTQQAGLSR